jgi:hypothetical protein
LKDDINFTNTTSQKADLFCGTASRFYRLSNIGL